jgi:hypothetical protein
VEPWSRGAEVGDGVPQKLGADLVGDGLAEMHMYVSDVISSVSGVGGCEIGDLEEQWERCFHVMMLRWHFFFLVMLSGLTCIFRRNVWNFLIWVSSASQSV